MKKTNLPILLANILTCLAFLIHAFAGDAELVSIQPAINNDDWAGKQQIWTMARCGWHWISFDLLFASVALALVNFTSFFQSKKTILQLLYIYFLGYACVWLLVIAVSDAFPLNFLKLGQWMLLLAISGLIYLGAKRTH
jgi:hypothetical protein